jgi:hypothetical protein
MTRDFLEECSEKFYVHKLKYIFIFDPSTESGLHQIFDVKFILDNRIDNVIVSLNLNICVHRTSKLNLPNIGGKIPPEPDQSMTGYVFEDA